MSLTLPVPDPEQELRYVMDAVRTIRRELNGDVPLIGFSGSPWTLATYMVEGGSSKTFGKIKKMAFVEPEILHMLLDKLADSVILVSQCPNRCRCPVGDDLRYLGWRLDATGLQRVLIVLHGQDRQGFDP